VPVRGVVQNSEFRRVRIANGHHRTAPAIQVQGLTAAESNHLDRQFVVAPRSFASKSVNTPFGGWTLRGGPVMTIVGGRIVHDARQRTPD
jgi:hypothetical protein